MKPAIGLLAIFIFLVSCDKRPDQWDAFIYPDATNLTVNDTIRGFKTFELCQQAAINRLRASNRADKGDYECGYKCEPYGHYGIYRCAETRK
jgi:hypothetical protein